MNKKFFKKVIIELMVFSIFFAVLTPLATTVLEASAVGNEEIILEAGFDAAKPTRYQLRSLGLSDEEIDLYLNSDESGITLNSGIAYDEHGNPIEDEVGVSTFGKFSWAVKAIRIAIYKLPTVLRNKLFQYTSLYSFLVIFEHMTGTIENAIYWTCIQVGMPDWLAWTIAKALTLLI